VLCADNGNRGRVGAEANLEQWLTSLPSLTTGESKFGVTFDWEVGKLGVPGAIIVKNHHSSEFFLKTITLDDVPGRGTLTFVANSWVYPQSKYRYNRVFFTNDVSLSLSLSLCPSSLFLDNGIAIPASDTLCPSS
jgi:linoleate 9S-lipoxygenase